MLKRALATLVICVFPTACGKQSDAIVSIAVHPTNPNILYVSTNERVYKTRDGGHSWRPMNKGLETLDIRAIVMSSLDPHTLYAGTNGSGLYRSKDGAQTWTRVQLVTGPTASRSTAS